MNSEKEDAILDEAIYYATHGCYSEQVTKEKKRAIRKRAVNLVVEAGEVFMKKKEWKVCMYTLIYVYKYIYKLHVYVYIYVERETANISCLQVCCYGLEVEFSPGKG